MGRALVAVLCLLFLLPGASAQVQADLAMPQIVHKPLVIHPGEQVRVEIYNGGRQLWSDLSVVVADTGMGWYRDVLGPESFAQVGVDVPFAYLLDAEELQVSLYYDGRLLDSRPLAIDVVWPAQQLFVDPKGPAGPEFIVLIDASQHDIELRGIQVETALLKDGKVAYFDFLGPFYLGADERFVWRSPLPERYLSKGEFEVRGTFYEGEAYLAETSSTFLYDKERQLSLGPLLAVILSLLLLVLVYVIIDMLFHRSTLAETMVRFKE